ncbi:hypothetical protein RRG08_003606 [Elysia crispata]|uniref:Uncharacterized protein n=1 Tax=Elysia crispata TaxID=231223 RepID=A0AAE1ATS9_9GAST|nr:hypothetical protein RRG08_003606 [Elysia crispata]
MWFVVQRKQSAEPQARSTLPENPAEPSKVLQVFKQHWAGSAKIERWFELPIKVLNDFFEDLDSVGFLEVLTVHQEQ